MPRGRIGVERAEEVCLTAVQRIIRRAANPVRPFYLSNRVYSKHLRAIRRSGPSAIDYRAARTATSANESGELNDDSLLDAHRWRLAASAVVHRLRLACRPSGGARRRRRRCRRTRRGCDRLHRTAGLGRRSGRPAEVKILLAREHVRRDDVVAAERAAPDGIRGLCVTAGHAHAPPPTRSAQDRVNQLGGNIERRWSRARPRRIRRPCQFTPPCSGCGTCGSGCSPLCDLVCASALLASVADGHHHASASAAASRCEQLFFRIFVLLSTSVNSIPLSPLRPAGISSSR